VTGAAADTPTAANEAPPDVVEVIPEAAPVAIPAGPSINNAASVPEARTTPSVAVPVLPAAGTPPLVLPKRDTDRFELTGWARQSVELGFSRDARRPDQPERTALPYDRVVLRSQLFMQARYSRERWFEADVSGVLSYSAFEQGPAHETTAFNGFNGRSTRGAVEPELRELFVGFFSSRIDLRLGQQRIAWGKGDFVSPNDVMNARDRRDPFVGETELQHLPTLAARLDLDLGIGTLEGIAEPVYTPDRFDVSNGNWSAVQPGAPVWARGFVDLVDRSTDPTVREAEQRLLAATRNPKSDFTQPVLGARWSWTFHGGDMSYYYQYGFDGPKLDVDPTLLASLSGLDYSTAGLADLGPLFRAIDAGQSPIVIEYVRRHHVGADAGTSWGPVALRLDVAYDSKKVFVRTDFLGATSPAFQAVASVEYQTGEIDKDILLEGIYQRVLDPPTVPLLIYARDTVAAALDFHWPLFARLALGIRALVGFQPRTELVQPQLDLNLEPLVLSAGGLILDGKHDSFGDYFQRNDEVYLKAKYSF
jgi:hypothetical protein